MNLVDVNPFDELVVLINNLSDEKSKRILLSKAAEVYGYGGKAHIEALEVGVDWFMKGNEDRKNFPVDQKMTDWLWEHPDVREKIWNMMKNEE